MGKEEHASRKGKHDSQPLFFSYSHLLCFSSPSYKEEA